MEMKNTIMTTCPLCGKNLSRCRIDVRTSILFCKDLKCPYPVGHDCTVFKKKKRQNSTVPGNQTNDLNLDTTKPFASTSEENFNVESVANMLIDDITNNCATSDNMNHNEFFDLGVIQQESVKRDDTGQLKEVYDELNDILAGLN